MSRMLLNAYAILALALCTFAVDANAQNCSPLPGGIDSFAWAWGADYYGQLGDGATSDGRVTPLRVLNLSAVVAVAGGLYHGLAVKSDGTVWAWGYNNNGQLGDGSATDRYTPVQVYSLNDVKSIAAGAYHSLALKSDGTVWAWGSNNFGQLGWGSVFSNYTAVQAQNLTGVTAVAAGLYHSLALKSDGTVWSWGDNYFGELGRTGDTYSPAQVQSLSGVTAIAAGAAYSLAVKNDGTVWAWGLNQWGELGDGTTDDRRVPVQVQNLSGVTAVAARYHSLALKSDCTVWAWGGLNLSGELGDGTTDRRLTPVQVHNLTGGAAVGVGNGYSITLKSDGTVWAWGQLVGPGSGHSSTPVQVQNLKLVTNVAVGDDFALAVAPMPTYLSVLKILMHPDPSHLRLFNLQIDGANVRANINGGSTGPQLVSPGVHTVSETGGMRTPLGAFTTVIGGDCAADGTVTLQRGDSKTCTITNYDHSGGCLSPLVCCEPGDDTQGCRRCGRPSQCFN